VRAGLCYSRPMELAREDPRSFRASPILVGGLGGSGTRLVARMLERLGVAMGRDQNREADYLGFTLLFKRPAWALRELGGAGRELGGAGAELPLALEALETALLGPGPQRPEARRLILRAALSCALRGHDAQGSGRGPWALARAARLLRPQRLDPRAHAAWGFKEPNSLVFLGPLAARYPGLRFVLVVRSGLDMAFSRNRAQAALWSGLHGLRRTGVPEVDQLAYWVRANRRAAELGRRLLGERLVIVDYDDLCRDPGRGVAELAARLGLAAGEPELAACAALVEPRSLGRHRHHDLGRLPRELVDEALELEQRLCGRGRVDS
jgi:hypothetical protein